MALQHVFMDLLDSTSLRQRVTYTILISTSPNNHNFFKGEEALNPQRNIPLSIIFTLIISFFAYFGISTILTMALPYYLVDPVSPFPNLFQQLGWIEIKWIVTIGAIFALCSSLFTALFALPRVSSCI